MFGVFFVSWFIRLAFIFHFLYLEQRWKLARKNFHYATLGSYADIADKGLGQIDANVGEHENAKSGGEAVNGTGKQIA